jgi:hypothetical protein
MIKTAVAMTVLIIINIGVDTNTESKEIAQVSKGIFII